MVDLTIIPERVEGLPPVEQEQLRQLAEILNYHRSKNANKARYYDGHVSLSDVNLGIALPENIKKIEIGCSWGAKCVDVLAARSMFDGFVGTDGNDAGTMTQLVSDNRLISQYMRACKDELRFGCTFATLSADERIGCRIRFHSPMTASARWSGEKGRIDSGLAIIDTAYDESEKTWTPAVINLYTDTAIWVLHRSGTRWVALRHAHNMGRPLMEPLVWNATSAKPFGRSRIDHSVRELINAYVRTIANATIALEFETTPQKYIIGLTDEQYDAIVSNKFKQYVGSILAATTNPETGANPQFGQLTQGNIEPHVQMIRILATQFSAATGLTVTDVGVVNDANPTSSDAILAQSQTLVTLAEQLNSGNGDSLNMIARMAEAISQNKTLDELSGEENDVIAHFKNPAMPSVSVTADAAIKIASARPEFSSTDTFLEMIGFSQADIRRIKAQEQRARGQQLLTEEFSEEATEGTA